MPPKKPKKSHNYTQHDVILATAEVSSGIGMRKTAIKYNIPYSTLCDLVHKRTPIDSG